MKATAVESTKINAVVGDKETVIEGIKNDMFADAEPGWLAWIMGKMISAQRPLRGLPVQHI